MPAGAPQVHDRVAILQAFLRYISSTEIPIVAEFAASHGLYRQFLYDCDEFADALKQCVSKKEGALERKALDGQVNCTMAIFSLKQLGWSDKQETVHKGDAAAPIVISATDSKL